MDQRDRIHLRDHVVTADIGAFQTERGQPQRLRFTIEVDLAEDASFHHVASKRAVDPKVGIGHIFARVGSRAQFQSFTLAVNGTVMRNEAVMSLFDQVPIGTPVYVF